MKSCLWPRNQFWRFRRIFVLKCGQRVFPFWAVAHVLCVETRKTVMNPMRRRQRSWKIVAKAAERDKKATHAANSFPVCFTQPTGTRTAQHISTAQHNTAHQHNTAQHSTAYQYSTVHQHNSTQYNTTYRHQDWGTRSRDRGQPLISFFRMNRWTNEEMNRWRNEEMEIFKNLTGNMTLETFLLLG